MGPVEAAANTWMALRSASHSCPARLPKHNHQALVPVTLLIHKPYVYPQTLVSIDNSIYEFSNSKTPNTSLTCRLVVYLWGDETFHGLIKSILALCMPVVHTFFKVKPLITFQEWGVEFPPRCTKGDFESKMLFVALGYTLKLASTFFPLTIGWTPNATYSSCGVIQNQSQAGDHTNCYTFYLL